MSFLADSHMHTPLCGHAAGDPVEYVEAAHRRGLHRVSFACHIPMRDEATFRGRGVRMRLEDLGEYFRIVGEGALRGRELGVEVGCGIEAEVYDDPRAMAEMERILADWPFDFVLGSLHHQLTGFRQRVRQEGLTDHQCVDTYFNILAREVRSGRYDSVAHPDIIRSYGTVQRFVPEEHPESLGAFLDAVEASGTCLEVNTSGLIKEQHEIHPYPVLLREAARRGIRLTLGSDAHRPEQVGQFFPETILRLREIGFEGYRVFVDREPRDLPFPDFDRERSPNEASVES